MKTIEKPNRKSQAGLDLKNVDKIIAQVMPDSRLRHAAAQEEPIAHRKSAATGSGARGDRDHIDAINQIFAEFELAYHNQFHKAYSQEGSLKLAKKYWLSCLADFMPEVIVRAGRQVVKSQEYLPTVASMVHACENAFPLFGLPASQAAYVEACCAPEPKQGFAWSHPAVYLAAQHTGWFALVPKPGLIFFRCSIQLHLLCQRVLHGEELDISIPVALPATVHLR